MNKNSRRNKPAILEANKNAKRKSRNAKVAAKEQSGDKKGMSLIDQAKMFHPYLK